MENILVAKSYQPATNTPNHIYFSAEPSHKHPINPVQNAVAPPINPKYNNHLPAVFFFHIIVSSLLPLFCLEILA